MFIFLQYLEVDINVLETISGTSDDRLKSISNFLLYKKCTCHYGTDIITSVTVHCIKSCDVFADYLITFCI